MQLTVRGNAQALVCFHFQQTPQYLIKQFTFRLGNGPTVHLCPQCAEQLANYLQEQLQADREVQRDYRPES